MTRIKCIFLQLIIFLSIVCISTVFGQETKVKLVLMPLQSQADASKYSTVGIQNTAQVVNRTLFTFIRLLPFVELAEENPDTTMKDPSAIAKKYGVTMVIYGSFSFTGERNSPGVVFQMKIWSEDLKKEIFSKSFTSGDINYEMLDTVDGMLQELVSSAFKINAEMATIVFSDFSLNEPYELTINDKAVSVISNSDYNQSLRILADKNYHILLTRLRDKMTVIDRMYDIKPQQTTNIGYHAAATLNLSKVAEPDVMKRYSLIFDGQNLPWTNTFTGISVLSPHTLLTVDQFTNVIQSNDFNLLDEEVKWIDLRDELPFPLRWRILSTGGFYNYGVGADLFINRYFWTGVEVTFGWYPKWLYPGLTASSELFSVLGNIEVGHYLPIDWGTILPYDIAKNVRLGGGLTLMGYYAFPQNAWATYTTDLPYNASIQAFAVLEYWIFYAKFYVGYKLIPSSAVNALPIDFYPEIGIRF